MLLPGTILLCATTALLAWTAPWRGSLRASRPATIALASLAGLGGWAALSALWSPAPDIAIGDGQRILAYALAFGLGIWLCHLLAGRLHLALVPLAVAGAFAGVVTVVGMLTGDDVGRYLDGGTLEYPLGYRNANAAFFAIALWPALGLASHRAGPWPVRGAALATATLCLELAMLSQSPGVTGGRRGGAVRLPLLLAGSGAQVGLAGARRHPGAPDPPRPDRPLPAPEPRTPRCAPRSASCAGRGGRSRSPASARWRSAPRPRCWAERSPPRRGASRSPTAPPSPASWRRCSPALPPSSWRSAIPSTGSTSASPSSSADEDADLGGQSNRFSSLNAGTRRPAIWRVALIDARDHPLLGEGGGGFLYSYLRERERDSPVSVHDAHSVELENLSEFGVPGLLLFAGAIGAAGLGAVAGAPAGARAGVVVDHRPDGRRLLARACLARLVLALPGRHRARSSPCSAPPARRLCAPPARRRGVTGGAGWPSGAVVLAISAVPPYLSERYVNDAYDEWRSDSSRAYDDLDRAQALNPLSVVPVLAEGAIARANGDRARAIDAFRRAASKRPEEWASHYNLAELYARSSPRLARRKLAIAKRLNPYDPEVLALEERFAEERRRGDADSSEAQVAKQRKPTRGVLLGSVRQVTGATVVGWFRRSEPNRPGS